MSSTLFRHSHWCIFLALTLALNHLTAAPACCPDGDAFLELFGSSDEDAVVILSDSAVQSLGITLGHATNGPLPKVLNALGSLEPDPAREQVIASRIEGRVQQLLVQEGDRVTVGQELLKIEPRLIGSVEGVTLTSPLDGMVVSTRVRTGSPVERESSLITVVDDRELLAIAHIQRADLESILSHSDPIQADIRISSLPSMPITGTMERIGTVADPTRNTIPVLFRIQNQQGLLRPGMATRFQISIRETNPTPPDPHSVLIPIESLQGEPGRYFIYVPDPEDPLRFHRRPVRLRHRDGGTAWIEGPLHPGDPLVTRGAYPMRFAGAVERARLAEVATDLHGHDHDDHEDGDESHTHDEHGHTHWERWLLFTLGISTLLLFALILLQRFKTTKEGK